MHRNHRCCQLSSSPSSPRTWDSNYDPHPQPHPRPRVPVPMTAARLRTSREGPRRRPSPRYGSRTRVGVRPAAREVWWLERPDAQSQHRRGVSVPPSPPWRVTLPWPLDGGNNGRENSCCERERESERERERKHMHCSPTNGWPREMEPTKETKSQQKSNGDINDERRKRSPFGPLNTTSPSSPLSL